jgi:hypothetical protein
MKKKIEEWFLSSFMRGFTIFHLVGIVLMVAGGSFGSNFTWHENAATLPQIAGFLTFFWEVFKTVAKTIGEFLGNALAKKAGSS